MLTVAVLAGHLTVFLLLLACLRVVGVETSDVTVVEALPKTRSGKILRGSMRDIADGHDGPPPATIDDPAVLEALRRTLRKETSC